MSRCCPYSFSEFKKQKELRIESSIKLLKEKDRENKKEKKEKEEKEKKSENQEKKRERREKKREKKEKKNKTRDETLPKDDKKHGNRKRTCAERNNLDPKCDFYPKTKEGEIEQLERSSLTEELGLPSSRDVCDSPDSSQNSHKRTKHNAIDVSKSTIGNGLLIRLQLSKQGENLLKQPSALLLQQREYEKPVLADPPCFSLPIQKQTEQASLMEQPCLPLLNQSEIKQAALVGPCLPFLKQNEAVPCTQSEQPSFSGRTETILSLDPEKPRTTFNELNLFKGHRLSGKSRKKEAEFRDLIVNWQPHPLQVDDQDDQNWLFGGGVQPKQHDISKKSAEAETIVSDEGSVISSWPPRARHLLKPDLFALPFVLPF